MKNLISYAALLGLGLSISPSISFAQNYVPPSAYGGPNVIVNMDVLSPAPMMAAPMPLTAQRSGLRSPAEARANVPLRLRRPATQQQRPIMAAPMPTAQAPLVLKQPAARQITSAPLAPLSPVVNPTMTNSAPVPEFMTKTTKPEPKPEPKFSAKELVKAADPVASVAPINPVPEMIATPKKKVAKAIDETKTRQRELLAKAREDVLYDGDRAKELIETAKVEPQKMAERTVTEIENIAPSAPKLITPPKMEMPAPMPPMAALDPVKNIPAVKEKVETVSMPILPPFVAPTPKKLEKPVETKMAALTTPKVSTTKPTSPAPTPVVSAPVAKTATLDAGQDSFRLLFGGQSADLSQDYTAVLDQIAARLTNSKDSKIQLRAFADGTPETTSKARRLSLTRALTVRSYLLDKGVSATSMDVRALGVAPAKADTSADRVDIVFIR